MEDVKSQMEGLTRVYIDLDNKISDKGGMQNLFGMNRKIRQALESISIGELDSMLGEIHRAKEGLTRLQFEPNSFSPGSFLFAEPEFFLKTHRLTGLRRRGVLQLTAQFAQQA